MNALQTAQRSPEAIALDDAIFAIERKAGRPTSYNNEIAATIIEGMANGKTVLALCREEWCPKWTTIYRWTEQFPAFRDAFWRARVLQSHAFADQALECPDMALASLVGDKSDNARVNAWRVKFEALKWRAGVYNAEYRDKQLPMAGAGAGVTVVISGLEPAKVIEG